MLYFCGYCACYCCCSSCSSCSSPVYGFPGRPPGGAGCRERSQRSCLRLDAKPRVCSDRNGRATLVAPWPALPASRQKTPGCKANAWWRCCGGLPPLSLRCHAISFQPRRRGQKTATTVSASPGVKCTSRKTFCPKAGKNFCGLPPDSRFRPWQ